LKKLFTFVAVLLLVGVFVSAQDLGAIRGKVIDEDGTPLPGVSVTLTGGRPGTSTEPTSQTTPPWDQLLPI